MGTRNVITVLGAVAGYAIAGPAGARWGLLLGGVVGNAVDPVQIEGARLEDLRATGYEYGTPIPHVYGTPRLPGIVAWASEKQEIEQTSGGKGGPETTSYSYKQDILYELTANEIAGVRRIWANGKLVWSAANDATEGTLEASADSPVWDSIEVFTGISTQLPWSVYEAAVGVGNAPAMRGRGCVGITGLNLGSSGYAPQLTFEVVTNGTTEALADIDTLFVHEATMPGTSTQPRVGSIGFTTNDKSVQVLQPLRYELRNDADNLTRSVWATEDEAREAGRSLLSTTQVSPPSDLLGSWNLVSRTVTPASPGGLTYLRFDYTANFLCNDSMICGTDVFTKDEFFFVRYPEPDNTQFTDEYGAFTLSDAESVIDTPDEGTQFALVAFRGSGDESVVVAKGGQELSPSTARYMYGRFTSSPYPTGVLWTNTQFNIASNWVYTCHGEYIWMMIFESGDRFARQFLKTGGEQLATSVDLGDYPSSMATDGTTLWVHLRATGIQPINALDMSLSGSIIAMPGGEGSNPTIHCDSDGNLQVFGNGKVWRRDFDLNTWDIVLDIGSEGASGVPYGSFFHVPVYTDGKFYCMVNEIDGTTSTMTLYGNPDSQRITVDAVPLSDVVLDLCERSGLETSYVNVSQLTTKNVRALAITQVSTARQVIETLMAAYFFNAREAAQLVFVLRGQAQQDSIPYVDMGAGVDSAVVDPLQVMRRSDVEIPAQVSVTYANFNDDYQQATETSDRLIGRATGVAVVQIPMAFTPQEAKRIADASLLDGVTAATSIGPLTLDRRCSNLEPTDVVIVSDEAGTTYRVRVDKINDADGVRSVELLLDDATVLNSTALTDESYTGSTVVRALSDTVLVLGDWPIFRDADNEPGHYAAFAPDAEDGTWPGAALFRGVADTAYTEQLRSTGRTAIGETTTALGDWDGGDVFDEMNSVTVSVGTTLSSYTRDQILNGTAPLYMIGAEAIYARTATLVNTGVYTLTGLLRGRRGTEWAIGTHVIGDQVVRISLDGVRRATMESGQLGAEFSFKAPTFGRSVAGATEVEFTNSGVGLKPFSPVDLRAARDPSTEDVVLTWKRRTRLSCRFTGGVGINVPLGETSEAYVVEIRTNDSPQLLLRTVESSSPTITYTATEQYDDGIVVGSPIEVTIYQVSSTVGRGYPLVEAVS